MDTSVRWMAFAAALGFCVAFSLWGLAGAPVVLTVDFQKINPSAIRSSALKFDPPVLDFGDIFVGHVDSKVVRMTNPTDKPITIIDIRGSCGCISLDLKSKIVPANSTVDLTVHYTGLAGSAKREYGVTATTDEHENAKASFPLQAHTVSIFKLEPALIYFDVKPGDTEQVQTTKLTRVDGQAFSIRGADIRNKQFTLKWLPVPDSKGTAYELTCTLKTTQISAGVETMAIITDHPTHPIVELKASVRGVSSVSALIPVLVGQWKDGVKQLEFSTPIQRNTPGTLEITDVKDGAGQEIKVTLTRRSPTVIDVGIVIPEPAVFMHNRRDGEFVIQTNVLPEPMRLPFTVPPPPAVK
jgi:hypothetical protein